MELGVLEEGENSSEAMELDLGAVGKGDSADTVGNFYSSDNRKKGVKCKKRRFQADNAA